MKQEGHFSENDREWILGYLGAMGIVLPPRTKLPIGELDKKLTKALDSAQRFSKLLPDHYLDPSAYRKWRAREDGPVLNSTLRTSIDEGLIDIGRIISGTEDTRLYNDVFFDIRQTVVSLGRYFDCGLLIGIIEDEAGQSTIIFRVIDVLFLKEKTPVFVLLFHKMSCDSTKLSDPFDYFRSLLNAKDYAARTTATLLEQKLLLRLLRLNKTRISLDYAPRRYSMEEDFELSFLLPLGPVTQVDIAKLVEHTGCVICGGADKSRCANCLSQLYCSKECQRAHWPLHKKMCKNIAGGTWTSASFTKFFPGASSAKNGSNVFHINRFNPLDEPYTLSPIQREDPIPVDVYGSQPFLVKIQLALDNASNVMIYDRRRTIQIYITPQIDQDAFLKMTGEILLSPLLGKIYRWAKRTGDLTLSICIDREPMEEEFNW